MFKYPLKTCCEDLDSYAFGMDLLVYFSVEQKSKMLGEFEKHGYLLKEEKTIGYLFLLAEKLDRMTGTPRISCG
jgi:hypothetical protein